MRRYLAALAALVVLCGLAMAADQKRAKVPLTWMAEKVLPGTTVEAAWGDLAKELMSQAFHPTVSDYAGGLMYFISDAAEQGGNILGQSTRIMDDDCAGVTLLFRRQGDDILVIGRWRDGYGGAKIKDWFYSWFGIKTEPSK